MSTKKKKLNSNDGTDEWELITQTSVFGWGTKKVITLNHIYLRHN